MGGLLADLDGGVGVESCRKILWVGLFMTVLVLGGLGTFLTFSFSGVSISRPSVLLWFDQGYR